MNSLIRFNYAEIARRTGKSRQHIRECLRGTRNPSDGLKHDLIALGIFGGRRAQA